MKIDTDTDGADAPPPPADVAAENARLRAELAAIQQRQRDQAAELARANGEWQKLSQLQTEEIAAARAAEQQLRSELTAERERLAAADQARATAAFSERVASQLGGVRPTTVAALLTVAGIRPPSTVTDRDIAAALKAVVELEPSLRPSGSQSTAPAHTGGSDGRLSGRELARALKGR